MTLDLKALNRMLDEFGPTVAKGNDTPAPEEAPTTTKSVGDDLAQPYGDQFNFLSKDDSVYMQRRLNGLDWNEKGYLLQKQIEAGEGRGVPLRTWQQSQFGAFGIDIRKALDTTGGSALIRQDLEPFLVSIF